MKLSQILGVAAVGGLIYLAYKYGEKEGQKNTREVDKKVEVEDAEIVDEKSEEDCIREIIESIKKKQNKNQKDRDTIELLQIKLKQLKKEKENAK